MGDAMAEERLEERMAVIKGAFAQIKMWVTIIGAIIGMALAR